MSFIADPRETCSFCGGDTVLRSENKKLAADAQALADVRTLDDWRRANRLVRQVVVGSRWGRVLCQLQEQGVDVVAPFVADSEEEARAKAAAWVREQKR